ncbi:WbqC family protein [Namhaeicola litoreus]|uniref:WbqC family protein n=1 Tax=Namhaeicola litoreus TaxID=1052145 RepID=A0ABW3Y5B8_9FLAO
MFPVLQPTYFSPIIQFVAIAKYKEFWFELEDNFQKQTYRNRCYVFGANGNLLLNLPIVHEHSGQRQKTKEVKLDPQNNWQLLHKKSLEAAYRSSPYFEFYEEEINLVFEKKYTYLIDLLLDTNEVISEALELNSIIHKTKHFEIEYAKDLRIMSNAKLKQDFKFESYHQVFSDKHGFLANLSILDLLFNEGPNSLDYLLKHSHLLS